MSSRFHLFALCFGLCSSFLAWGEEPVSPLVDVFPPPEVFYPGTLAGVSTWKETFSPSGSVWAEGLNETRLFHRELHHEQGADDSFRLRLGTGGQIYSLRGAFGESIPPSYHGSRHRSPWNDEVWQFVAVCTRYNGLEALQRRGPVPAETADSFEQSGFSSSFFVHNSGAYMPGHSEMDSFYSPLLAHASALEGRAHRTLNWGVVPQVRTLHRSPILYYVQSRDVGQGVIELTWVVHNFSLREDVVFDHLNAPWGGTRVTSLPMQRISDPEGKLRRVEEIIPRISGAVNVRDTGGWNLSSVTEDPDSPALALVFGRDKHWEDQQALAAVGGTAVQIAPSLYRHWRHAANLYEPGEDWGDWRTRPENNFRNYDVMVVIPKLRLAPGKSIWYRSFLVVNTRQRAAELAASLVDSVDYGALTFDPDDTPLVPAFPDQAEGDPSPFLLYAHPVPGSVPLFRMAHRETGRQVISSDPYHFVPSQPVDLRVPEEHPDHGYYAEARGYELDAFEGEWKGMLGYALREKPAEAGWVRLSECLPADWQSGITPFHTDPWVRIPEAP